MTKLQRGGMSRSVRAALFDVDGTLVDTNYLPAVTWWEAAAEPWIDVRCEVGCCRAATRGAFQQAGFTPHRVVEADEYWPAQGFIAARLGLALIPAVALGVLHDGVAGRRLHHASQPVRHVLAATRPTISGTVPVQAIITALQAGADAQRNPLAQPKLAAR